MAVSGITDGNSVLLSVLASRQRVPLRNAEVSTPAPTTAPVTGTEAALPAPEAPAPDAIQQNALLINEILRNLRFTPAGPGDILQFGARSPFLTALQEDRELNPIQQNALLVNETLRNVGFTAAEPVNPFLTDEIPPALEASEITEELDLVGANAQLITQTLQGLGVQPQANAILQPPPAAVQVAAVAGQVATVAGAATTAALPGTVTAAVAAPAAAAATPGAATAFVLPAAATVQTAGLTPATMPVTVFPGSIPFVLPAYQLTDHVPPPASPEPVDREVAPVASVGGVRAVGGARLRQIMLRAREKEQTQNIKRNIDYTPPLASSVQAEKSIRFALGRVNADMAARDLPLHLVLAKNEQGLAYDVYECSYPDACRVSYDVPIALDNLPGLLGSLEHETGIIVDTKS